MGWGSLNQQQITVLLRLLGAGPYNTAITAAGANTRRLGAATQATGLAMRTASQRTWLMNQALYTMRRYAFYGTLAIVGIGIALGKLGYQYLATRDSARAALSPIFKDTASMNRELNRLFVLSKFSPFVLKDMTDALRVMYPSLHGAGLGVHEMNQLLLSMTNILSQSGRTTPQALSRISYAIQHMIYQGRLTGRLVQSLASSGVDVVALLSRLGYAHANLSSISRLNIPPQNVIRALIELGQSGIFKGAALRISMRSLPGMFQVMKDSLSQFMGIFLQGKYNRFKGEMFKLVGPGGLMDKLGKAQSPRAAVLALSTAATGGGGLGNGFLLLASIVSKLTILIVQGLVPAFVIALHSLIVFWPTLSAINLVLGFLTHHLWLVKAILIPLAAWFILTHFAMLAFWTAEKLVMIMSFGTAGSLRKLGIALFTFEGRVLLTTKAMRLWQAITKGQVFWNTAMTISVVEAGGSLTIFERAIIATRGALVGLNIQTGILLTTLRALTLIGIITIGIELVIHRQGIQNWLKKELGNNVGTTVGQSLFMYHPIFEKLRKNSYLKQQFGGFAMGTSDFFGSAVVGEGGPELLTSTRRGASVTPLSRGTVTPIGALSNLSGGSDRPIVVQLVVDRKVLAQTVARERQDQEARR